MADSCSDIYAAIASLERKIDSIPRVDENSIINKAVDKSSGVLKPRIDEVGVIAGGAVITAGGATKLAGDALARLGILAAELGGVIVRLAAVVSLVLNIVATIATYVLLSRRIDALERVIQAQQEIINAAINKADRALAYSNNAITKANAATDKADAASRQASQAIGKANFAIDSANRASDKADQAIQSANKATAKAEDSIFRAEKAIGLADTAIYKAENAINQVNAVNFKAEKATGLANSAHRRLDEFDRGVRALHADFVTRLGLAVTYFEGALLGNVEELHGILDIHRNTIYNQLEPGLSRAEQKSNSALTIANQALNKANQTPRPTATNTNNLSASINAANVKADLALSTAVAANSTAQRALARPAGGVTIIPATGITRSEAELTRYINTTVAQAVGVTAQQAKAEQLRQQSGIAALQSQVAAIPTTVNAVNNRVTTVEIQTREQARLNQQGLAGIQQLTGLVQNLPNTFSSNPAFRSTITDLAEAGTCAATAPDNCLGQPLGNLGDLLNLILNNGLPGLDATLANVLSQILARLDTLESNANHSDVINRIYQILGGSSWFTNSTTPNLNINPETLIKGKGSAVYANPEAPTATNTFNLIDLLATFQSASFYRAGYHRLPALLPESLTQEDKEGQISIFDNLSFQEWLIVQLDAILGQYPIKIKYKDAEGTEQQLNLANQSESIAEMLGLLLAISTDTDTSVQLGFKSIIEAAKAANAAILASDYAKANAEYLGYRGKETHREIPLTVTPGKDNILEALKESKQKTIGWKYDDKEDLQDIVKRLLIGVEIVRAAFYRPYSPGDPVPGDRIKADRDADGVKDSAEWEAFFKRTENPPTAYTQPGQPKVDLKDLTLDNNGNAGG